MAEPRCSVRVRVGGKVQGVSFRAWTRAESEALGLDGWVRNEEDGSVSALLCGPADAVETMLQRLREGPRAAAVDEVAVIEAQASEPGWTGIRILR